MAQPTSKSTSLKPPWAKEEAKSPQQLAGEFKDLVVDYAKQETVDPLKTLGKYLGFGLSGSILVGSGLTIMLLGLLRALETIDFFNEPGQENGGTWSWLPYLITIVAALVIVGIMAVVIKNKTSTRRTTT